MSAPRNASSDGYGARSYDWRGRKLPSVTTILGAYPKPWLAPWAAKLTAEAAVTGWGTLTDKMHDEGEEAAAAWLKGQYRVVSQTAADLGTDIHSAFEARAKKLPFTVRAEVLPFLPQIEEWRKAYRPETLFSEPQLFNTAEGYAGSADLIARVYGRVLLVDLKTAKRGDGHAHHDWRLQLAAYQAAEFIGADDIVTAPMPLVDGCAILHIPHDVPAEWQFVEIVVGPHELAAFLAVKRVHDFIAENAKAGAGELILPQALEATA